MNKEFDIIIIGAGIVGLTFAKALSKLPLKIAIVDRQAPQMTWQADQYELRVSAITQASQNIFSSLGIWGSIAKKRISPFRQMQVWDASGDGQIHFNSADLAFPHIGHIIENAVIIQSLMEKIAECENITTLFGEKLEQVLSQPCPTLITEGGSQLTAKLIVGADGANSWLRKQKFSAVDEKDYGHHALVTTVETTQSHQQTAWQCFLPTGPLAFLPLKENNYSSIVWSTSPEQAKQLIELPIDDFKQQLAEAFDYRLGNIKTIAKRASFPLRMRHAQDYCQAGFALIGDAAHTVHPLAGQGVNMGLLDAAVLMEVIEQAVHRSSNFAELRVLKRYQRWRRFDNQLMLQAVAGFKHLFGNTQQPVTWLRNIGLNITDQCSPLKNILMRHAMGLSSDLPYLAKTNHE